MGLRENQRDPRGEDGSPQVERHSLLFLCLVLLCAVIKQLLVHLHKQLQGVVDQSMDCPAARKKDRVKEVLPTLRVVPGPQSALSQEESLLRVFGDLCSVNCFL